MFFLVEIQSQIVEHIQRVGTSRSRNMESVLFWQDMWDEKVLKLSYPQLFSFTSMENITLYKVLQQENLHDIFQLPLSEEAYMQYCEVNVLIKLIQENTDNDKWKYIWSNENFSTKKAYNHLIGSQGVHPAFRWFWNSSCQPKHKVFFWLLIKNRLNTRGLL
jgi:hypothetical protein